MIMWGVTMKNIAIIPARSGSKGVKDKNIKEIGGIPLMAYSINTARESKVFNTIMVSTDSKKYADIAEEYGAEVPFLRSEENSGDNAGSWQVVEEVLNYYYSKGIYFDTVCLLQPTSPLRTAEDITNGYELLNNKKADAITSVCQVEHSPLWTMRLPNNGSLAEFRRTIQDMPRQKLDQYYRLNGAIYIRKINYHEKNIEIMNKYEFAYVMEQQRSIDIDTNLDFILAELLMRKLQ